MPVASNQPTTILSDENITQATQAITTYKSTIETSFKTLDAAMTALLAPNVFSGDAANGFKSTYDTLKAGISTQIVGEDQSVTALLLQLLKTVEEMRVNVDQELGNTNKNALNSGASAPATENNSGGN